MNRAGFITAKGRVWGRCQIPPQLWRLWAISPGTADGLEWLNFDIEPTRPADPTLNPDLSMCFLWNCGETSLGVTRPPLSGKWGSQRFSLKAFLKFLSKCTASPQCKVKFRVHLKETIELFMTTALPPIFMGKLDTINLLRKCICQGQRTWANLSKAHSHQNGNLWDRIQQ